MLLRRFTRGSAFLVGLGLAAVGAVALPVGAFLGWLMVGALAGAAVWSSGQLTVDTGPEDRRAARRRSALVAAGTVWACLVGAGLIVLLGPAVVPVLAIAAILLGLWLLRRRRRTAMPAGAPDTWSTDELLLQWRRSCIELERATDWRVTEQLVLARCGYLDELERRDGGAFARWIVAGAQASSDPDRYLGSGS